MNKINMRRTSRIKRPTRLLPLLLLFTLAASACAQDLDLLIKGGHVIDAKNGRDSVMDVGIVDGVIAEVARDIAAERAETVVDATGLVVTPGLVDLHAHVFFGTESDTYSNSYTSLPPDGFTFRAGVTTVVDVGGAGWRNIEQFKEQTVAHAKTRVLSFLNIVGAGMKGGAVEQNLDDMDPQQTAEAARRHPDLVVGIKLAHFSGPDWTPTDRAVEAATLAGVPVMVDFGGADPPLPLDELLLRRLRPGDIFTHTYAHVNARTPIVDEKAGAVRPFVLEARERGIVFDVGHGGGSFVYSQAVPAIGQGFWPRTISTDLHTGSMNGGMKSLANVMSKFLNLGMPLADLVRAATWEPAQVIDQTGLGHLDAGAVADVAVFRLHTGTFGFVDTRGFRQPGSQKLEAELTVRAGQVVWDLNGLSRPVWEE